MDNLYFICWKG